MSDWQNGAPNAPTKTPYAVEKKTGELLTLSTVTGPTVLSSLTKSEEPASGPGRWQMANAAKRAPAAGMDGPTR
jgi:hypothetical protein